MLANGRAYGVHGRTQVPREECFGVDRSVIGRRLGTADVPRHELPIDVSDMTETVMAFWLFQLTATSLSSLKFDSVV